MNFKERLISELIQSDERQSKKPGHNRYAIGIYLNAADECAALVAKGATQETAFTEIFTPSREMHKVARKLGLILNVDHGQWWVPQS